MKTTKEIPKGQKASAKPDVYQEDVTKIRFPASKSSSSTKPPSVKTTLSERIRFPDKPTRTSPVKISIPSETPETSVTAGKDIQRKIGVRNRISIDFDATETTKEIPTENEFNPPRASTPTRDIEQSEKEPGETRMPWSLTRPKRKDWSEFSTFRKKKNVTSLLHEVSLKDVTPPLDETPPSDRSYGEGERNFGDKSLAFSTAGSVFGGAGDVSRHETDFVEEEEDNLQEDGNILNRILSHMDQ